MRSNRTSLITGLLLVASVMIADSAQSQQNKSIPDFFGVYVGRAKTAGSDEVRDLDVIIEPNKRGFSISWSAVIRPGEKRAVPGVKRRAFEQAFQNSREHSIFEPIAAGTVFSGRKKQDFVGGDPVIWARIQKDMLSVYSLVVQEDGTYQLQVYDRILTPLGMDIHFRRYDDGILSRGITSSLARIED